MPPPVLAYHATGMQRSIIGTPWRCTGRRCWHQAMRAGPGRSAGISSAMNPRALRCHGRVQKAQSVVSLSQLCGAVMRWLPGTTVPSSAGLVGDSIQALVASPKKRKVHRWRDEDGRGCVPPGEAGDRARGSARSRQSRHSSDKGATGWSPSRCSQCGAEPFRLMAGVPRARFWPGIIAGAPYRDRDARCGRLGHHRVNPDRGAAETSNLSRAITRTDQRLVVGGTGRLRIPAARARK